MVAIVLVGVIFIGTIVAVPAAISYTNFQAVEQQQVRNLALNIYNTMLQSPGNPENWGSTFPFDENNVQAFGLAKSDSLSRYVLDSNKVQRLDPLSPGYITYERTLELLELQGYGFKLTLFRPFKVGWDIGWEENLVRVDVNTTRTEDGAPIPNAKVEAVVLATCNNINKDDPLLVINQEQTLYTDLQGKCTLVESVDLPSGYSLDNALAVIHITVSGMETVAFASRNAGLMEYLKLNTFGDTVTLTFRGEFLDGEYSQGERRVYNIFGFDLEDLLGIYDGSNEPVTSKKINHGFGYDYWNRTFPGLSTIDPAMLLFVISVPNPRRLIVIGGPFSFAADEKVFEFGGEEPQGPVLTTLRRFVIISGMTYVTELILWKEY
jgi:hypothetical protein